MRRTSNFNSARHVMIEWVCNSDSCYCHPAWKESHSHTHYLMDFHASHYQLSLFFRSFESMFCIEFLLNRRIMLYFWGDVDDPWRSNSCCWCSASQTAPIKFSSQGTVYCHVLSSEAKTKTVWFQEVAWYSCVPLMHAHEDDFVPPFCKHWFVGFPCGLSSILVQDWISGSPGVTFPAVNNPSFGYHVAVYINAWKISF